MTVGKCDAGSFGGYYTVKLYLEPQAGNRDSKLEMALVLILSKPASSDIFPPAKSHLPNLLNIAANWAKYSNY